MRGRARSGSARSNSWPRIRKASGRFAATPIPLNPGSTIGTRPNSLLTPMLASLADAPLEDATLVYEPKYDGIRAIAEVPAASCNVRLWSRLGNEKTSQFPEIAEALLEWWRRRKASDKQASAIVDGEIVALDAKGEPTSFQHLQKRIHLTQGERDSARVAYIVFDLLRAGQTDYCGMPLVERRIALERLFGKLGSRRPGLLRLSEQVAGDGRALYKRAIAQGWEGLVV